jgi:hypothetical protein
MMIKIKRLIPIQLLCILLTSKTTFGQPNDEPFDYKMNVLIKWDRSLVGNQNWTGINERFELSLHHVDGQSGMTVQPPITIAKTGYDDLATLILPSQQIGIQNAAMEIEQRRKGKEKVGMVKFILRIQMCSTLNLKKPVRIICIIFNKLSI